MDMAGMRAGRELGRKAGGRAKEAWRRGVLSHARVLLGRECGGGTVAGGKDDGTEGDDAPLCKAVDTALSARRPNTRQYQTDGPSLPSHILSPARHPTRIVFNTFLLYKLIPSIIHVLSYNLLHRIPSPSVFLGRTRQPVPKAHLHVVTHPSVTTVSFKSDRLPRPPWETPPVLPIMPHPSMLAATIWSISPPYPGSSFPKSQR